jgi:RNA polymerase sigma-70 factor (ECF subfamily)
VDPIYGYCARRLDQTSAEDATSATFLNALRSIRQFDGGRGTFRSWLFTIAHNALIDQVRRQRPIGSISAEHPSTGASVEDQAADAEQRMHLERALRTLPNDQRDVIELRLANLTSPEIAQVLGKSPVAVRGLQHRAVKRLQTLLNPQETPDIDQEP